MKRKGCNSCLRRIVRITLSPVRRGEGRVRGRRGDGRTAFPKTPLTPTLSPEYGGEGAGECIASSMRYTQTQASLDVIAPLSYFNPLDFILFFIGG